MDYNNQLRNRLLEIFLADRDGFFEIDQNRFILSMLDKDWDAENWQPMQVHRDLIDRILEKGRDRDE